MLEAIKTVVTGMGFNLRQPPLQSLEQLKNVRVCLFKISNEEQESPGRTVTYDNPLVFKATLPLIFIIRILEFEETET